MVDSFRYYMMSDPDHNPHFSRLWVERVRMLDIPPPPSVRWSAAEMRHGTWLASVRPVAAGEVRQ
jgi:hypothetical protein